jgi:hypothetical protein
MNILGHEEHAARSEFSDGRLFALGAVKTLGRDIYEVKANKLGV